MCATGTSPNTGKPLKPDHALFATLLQESPSPVVEQSDSTKAPAEPKNSCINAMQRDRPIIVTVIPAKLYFFKLLVFIFLFYSP